MAWVYVILASIVEVFWVLGLRFSETIWEWLGTAILICLSFYFIIKACEKLPPGTVYALFTGSGATAIVILDILVFDAHFSFIKCVFIGLIIVGVIGIKLTTEERDEEQNPTRSTTS